MITIISSQDNKKGLEFLELIGGGEDRPEKGLHPIHHLGIASDWIKRHKAGEHVRVFTHSDLAIIRLLRRIEDDLMSCEDVEFFVFGEDGQFHRRELSMFSYGGPDFTEPWPCKHGFFNERGEELFGTPEEEV